MFADKRIVILSNKFIKLTEIMADVQGYKSTVPLDYNVTLPISKRVFCNPNSHLYKDIYFRINGKLFKPILVKEWDSYVEIYLYELRRDNVVERIDQIFDFFLFEWGEEVSINGLHTSAVVIDADNKIGEYDDKLLMVKPECKLGDLITYQEKKHLIFFPVEHNTQSYASRIRGCNHRIAFNYFGDTEWFDVLIESKTFDIVENQYISLPSGQILMWLQENEESTKIALNQRFLNTGRAWEVTGIDRTRPGLMKLFCELSLTNSDDNFELGIADYYKYFHSYELSIANTQPVGVELGLTTQLLFVLKDNGTQVATLQDITCISSNTTIATVDNTGLITGVANGTASITATLIDYPEITMNISVEVSGEVPLSYSIILTASSTELILGGFERTITATVYENGTAITGQPVTWVLTNQDGTATTKANITTYTGSTCKVKAPENYDVIGEYVVVKATLQSDSSVVGTIELLLTV